ncbi:PREDICTED: uncharacterized protein C22orf15 homolog [Nanorana parkeri]|uniref:uncharacterized protein C22orf15 homolog n=1 Tax=Nanorana parkeri TaxID=125878 RepID=UPI000853FB56|nr:PREDICTED: uncharacterized protein C22orf15 homolog [Nanorana parkeri]
MFITVKYGADNQILLNPNCKLVNLAEVLREKCQCGSEVSIDLLDESGTLINLSDLEGSQEVATNHLKERQCYILVKIIRGDGTEPARYESMLENLAKRHPELAERLQKLSNPHVRDKWRNPAGKKSRASKETPFTSPTKPRTASQQKSRPA